MTMFLFNNKTYALIIINNKKHANSLLDKQMLFMCSEGL